MKNLLWKSLLHNTYLKRMWGCVILLQKIQVQAQFQNINNFACNFLWGDRSYIQNLEKINFIGSSNPQILKCSYRVSKTESNSVGANICKITFRWGKLCQCHQNIRNMLFKQSFVLPYILQVCELYNFNKYENIRIVNIAFDDRPVFFPISQKLISQFSPFLNIRLGWCQVFIFPRSRFFGNTPWRGLVKRTAIVRENCIYATRRVFSNGMHRKLTTRTKCGWPWVGLASLIKFVAIFLHILRNSNWQSTNWIKCCFHGGSFNLCRMLGVMYQHSAKRLEPPPFHSHQPMGLNN